MTEDMRRYLGTRSWRGVPVEPGEPRPPREEPCDGDSLIAKVGKFVDAHASLVLYGPVPEEEQAERLAACHRPCPHLRVEGESEYCGKCGCPGWRRSTLQVKATMPAAKCPIGMWDQKPVHPRAPVPGPSAPQDAPGA